MTDIIKSSNYDQFDNLQGNRKISPSHIKHLIKSIEERNMLEDNPIIVSMGKIIDGQHRLEAARRLKLPFWYKEVEGATLDDVRRLNIYNRPWTLFDFVESYIELGNENYMILKDFISRYNLPLTVGIALLASGHVTGGVNLNYFKAGKFTVTHLKDADEKAKALVSIQPYTEGQIWRTRNFIAALLRVWSKIDKNVFQEKVVTRGIRLRTRLSVKEYLRDFEDIYNYNLKDSGVRFY